MIPEDKILLIDMSKIPEGYTLETYMEYLKTIEHPELIEGNSLIDKFTDETGL